MKTLLLVGLLLFTCGCKRSHDANDPNPDDKLASVIEKKNLYCKAAAARYQAEGRVFEQCDSLLFTSLWSAACGDVDIERFESKDDPGLWFRDPEHSCNLTDNSISNDMMLGLIIYGAVYKKKDMLRRLYDRAKGRDWDIGNCDQDHAENCRLWPSLAANLIDLTQSPLTQSSGRGDHALPLSTGIITGYRAHLAVLSVLLNGLSKGSAVNDVELKVLQDQADRQPRNSLFQALYHLYKDGDQSRALDLLLDPQFFPADHLPTNHDNHCTEYLYQRDDTPADWSPCPGDPDKEFSAVDYVFTAKVIVDFH